MDNFFEYINNFFIYDNSILEEIDKNSVGRKDIQPQVERDIGKLLAFLVQLTNAKKVLEFGTSIGYSSIWFASALSKTGGKLITVDNHIITSKEARSNINRCDFSNIVEFIIGDALDISKKLDGEFDIIFQDCMKSLYVPMHNECVRLVKKGGIIITDDTLFKASKKVRKNLGDHTDSYNKIIFADKRLYSVVLPIGDGLTLSLKL